MRLFIYTNVWWNREYVELRRVKRRSEDCEANSTRQSTWNATQIKQKSVKIRKKQQYRTDCNAKQKTGNPNINRITSLERPAKMMISPQCRTHRRIPTGSCSRAKKTTCEARSNNNRMVKISEFSGSTLEPWSHLVGEPSNVSNTT